MKKLLAFSASVLVCGLLQAQITITKNDMPVAGDSFTYATVLPVGGGVNVNNTGANYTWDYRQLGKIDDTVVKYERSSQTPYAFYFFNTMGYKIADNLGFGQFTLSNVYSFYKTTNTSFTAEGIGFQFSGFPLAGFYSDKDVVYSLPLQYGNSDSSNFRAIIQIPALGSYTQTGKRVNFVDGWGVLKLPGGKTYNCLRVKSVISQTDSIFVTQPFPVSFGFPSTRVEYKWLANTDRAPVLEVQGTELFGNFTPVTIRYRNGENNNHGAGIDELAQQASIYPNPATHSFMVAISRGVLTGIKLFTTGGSEISIQQNPTSDGVEVITETIAPGFYMLCIQTSQGVVWKKLQVVK